jgi:hypothetical protein
MAGDQGITAAEDALEITLDRKMPDCAAQRNTWSVVLSCSEDRIEYERK